MKPTSKTLSWAFVIILLAVGIFTGLGVILMHKQPLVLQGQAEATEIRISGKLPGRIDTFFVQEGDWVHRGDTLVVINSPEVHAKYQQVNALEQVAVQQNKKIDAGTRRQIVATALQLWNKTKSDLTLAQTTYNRILTLYKDSVITSQRKDEVEAMYKAAVAAERAAYEQYQMAVDGAQKEDKASAASMVDAARSTVDEVSALLVDARLTAPENGQIATIFPKRGELVAPGTPIMNLVVMDDIHVVLNVREDLMPQFKMDETFVADVPAIGKKNIEFKIYYISPLGSFATWKSTKQTGSYDLRTFEIHARPTQKVVKFRKSAKNLPKIAEKMDQRMDESQTYSPFRSVLLREWRRMTSRRLYFGVCIVLPLFTLFFMATIFGNGQMENIPIGIVDQDNTATSRTIVRNISAVPTFKVTKHFVNEAAARESVQKKEIYGYLSIPPQFEQNAITGKNATLSYYYHYALMSVGGELMAAFETSLAPVALSPVVMQAMALGVEQDQITTFLLPVQANNHPIYNPSLDYSVYLSQPFFFVLFQVLILLITVYAVGIEIKFRTADDWLATAKGNIVTAVLGKLLPYTIIYILIGWLANYVMFGILHIPFQGSWWLMNIMTVLFIIATQALGLFLFSLFPAISLVISVVSMVGSLGATLSGVTFPVPNMYPLVRDASNLFPVRHFTEMMQTMLYGGGGFIHLWPSAVILCIFPLLALSLLPHLKRAIESHKYENIK